MINWTFLTKHDPGLINLRKAARTVLVAPPLFLFFDLYIGNSLIGIFAFLSAFTLLVFASLGGPIRSRIAGYALLIVLTNGAVALGTALSGTSSAAALAMFALMFIVTFSTIYGGIAAALVAPIALAFSFTVFLPVEAIALTGRLFGWTLGGVIASGAALLLWPINIRADLRHDLAQTAMRFADTMSGWAKGDDTSDAKKHAAKALSDARTKAASPLRPASVAARDVGLHHLVDNFNYAQELITRLLKRRLRPADQAIADVIVDAFNKAAQAIISQAASGDLAKTIAVLDRARIKRRDEIRNDAAGLTAPGTTDGLEELQQSFILLSLSHVALWMIANVAAADGQAGRVHPVDTAPELSGETGAKKTFLQRAWQVAFAHLDPEGVIFHNSLRAAIAMALGVLVAKFAPVDHGFWIILGILSVLRSNASSTSATALRAILGTLAGFAVAALTMLVIGNHPNLYILLIPPYVFLAAYTPSTVGFAVGQASFTSMVVMVFNFVKPLGISTDFVRLETVTLGAITAAIVALILWPRGARAAIAQSVSDVYLAAAKGLRTGLRGSDEQRIAADRNLISAQQRAQAAFTMALSEHGEPINTGAWSRISRPPAMVRSALEGLLRSLPNSAPDGCQAANARLDRLSDDLAQHLEKIGADLSIAKSGVDAQRSNNTPKDILPDLQNCLAAGLAHGTQGTDDALTVMAWCDWLTQLDLALQETGPALESVAAASAPRAWLHWSTPDSTK